MTEIQFGEYTFPVRADFLSIKRAETEHGIRLEQLQEKNSLVDVGTLFFEFAKRGCELRKVQFEHTLDEFLGMIEIHQTEMLGELLTTILAGGSEKKRERKR
jgi:hypothetical protein